jgi:tRNA-dihydrouridine synthase B
MKLDLRNKLILAPMAEVSDRPFRLMCRKYGAGLTFTEMVSARGIVNNSFNTTRKVVFPQSEQPIGIQLLGNSPFYIGEAIQRLKKLRPAVFDLNAGCPVKKVTKNGFGVSILDNPSQLKEIVASMKSMAGNIPVSVKMRLGFRKISIIENAKICQEEGADFITLHPKTGNDTSDELPNKEWINKVKSVVSIPVLANGFVFSAEDAVNLLNETNADGVMVARGALGNPYIFDRYNYYIQHKNFPELPGINQIYDDVIEHIDLIKIEYGENLVGLNSAKKNIFWYFKKFNGIFSLIEKIIDLKNFEQIKIEVAEHTEKLKVGYFPVDENKEVFEKFKQRILFWNL